MARLSFRVFAASLVLVVWAIVVLAAVARDQYQPDQVLAGTVAVIFGVLFGTARKGAP